MQLFMAFTFGIFMIINWCFPEILLLEMTEYQRIILGLILYITVQTHFIQFDLKKE